MGHSTKDEVGESAAPISIPVIDISEYLAGGSASSAAAIATSLSTAAEAPGFFQITGHQVSPDLTARLLDRLTAFFALPIEVKKSIHRSQSSALRGWEGVGEQKLEESFSDRKEGFMIGPERPTEGARFLQGPNQWPVGGGVEGLEETMMEYFGEMLRVSKALFRLMALGLGLGETYFDNFVSSTNSISMCRAHRYPPTTKEMALQTRGIGAHTDFGALTLLLQDAVGGLEVYHRPSDTWHPVTPVPGALVVNIGDMLERWTNNRYSSTLHRVISPVCEKYRYSVAFFNEGLLDQMIECIPTCKAADEEPLHEPVLAEEHLRRRYGGSY